MQKKQTYSRAAGAISAFFFTFARRYQSKEGKHTDRYGIAIERGCCRRRDADGEESTIMRLLRGLGSHRLACGCLAGIYETYAGTTISIVDARGELCTFATHRVGERIESVDQAGSAAAVAAAPASAGLSLSQASAPAALPREPERRPGATGSTPLARPR